MKNKLILMLLMLTSSSVMVNCAPQYHTITYEDMSDKLLMIDSAMIQATLICTAWATKFTVYNFTEIEYEGVIIFIAHNHDCSFCIKFDRAAKKCFVEFNTRDESFDYESFERNMDSFFLTA